MTSEEPGLGSNEGATTPLLSLRGVTKHFGGVTAVRDVDFDLMPGEVHALVGENGAGKSTLMKLIAGVHQPDSGTLGSAGETVQMRSVFEAQTHGIAMIPQELELFDELSVAENLFVGRRRPRARWGGFDRRKMRKTAYDIFESLGVDVDPAMEVKYLPTATRQVVEIARALLRDARALIMDEPTAALTDNETARLFALIADLTAKGVGVVYISHRLGEIYTLADRVTVLRDGERVHTGPVAELPRTELVTLMVGQRNPEYRQHPATDVEEDARQGAPALEVVGLTRHGEFEDIDLSVHHGEVLGISGLLGAGRTELAQCLFGVTTPDEGIISLDGRPVKFGSPREAMQAGIGYVPEERRSQGLLLPVRIDRNITFSTLPALTRFGFVQRVQERKLSASLARRLTVRGAPLNAPVGRLSGGNQQKVVIAKALAGKPSVLILDEPTRGVDVGARAEIYRIIGELARDGAAILVISSEVEEILTVSDRILVLRKGVISGWFSRDEADLDTLAEAAGSSLLSGAAPVEGEKLAGRQSATMTWQPRPKRQGFRVPFDD